MLLLIIIKTFFRLFIGSVIVVLIILGFKNTRSVFGATNTVSLNPTDDAYINAGNVNGNYATATTLKVSTGTSVLLSYLKFNLSALAGQSITSAQLQLFVTNHSALTESIKAVTGTWSESTLTYTNRPSLGSQIGTIGPVSTDNSFTTIDLTSAVAANAGGILSLEIDTPGSDSLYFNSKENTANPPVLNVTFGTVNLTPTPTTILTPPPTPIVTLTPTLTPTSTPTPSGSDPVIAAAGDIACDPYSSGFNNGAGTSNSCHMNATANQILALNPSAVLPLGDNQYYCGSADAFQNSYSLSWGKFKSITHPTVGNHEYLTSGAIDCTTANTGAAGYYQYFGSSAGDPAKGYYSYNLGSWHLISLNTQCSSAGGCGVTSPQYKWLQADLAANPTACTLAYYHIPLYSSGGRASSNSKAMYQLLYNNHADVILTGHDHTYERFAPQDANGVVDPVNGIVEFVAGTGGANHTSFVNTAANSVIKNSDTFGVLKLTLHSNSYDWQFLPEPGKSFTDSGTAYCH